METWEATTGFEPVIGVLQTPALPLGHVAGVWAAALLKRAPVSVDTGDGRSTRQVHGLGCRGGDLNSYAQRAPPPQDGVSAYSTTSALCGG